MPEAVNETSLRTFYKQSTVTPNTYYPVEKLAIPKDYTSFQNVFDKLIGQSHMPAVLKFDFLKSYLIGEPPPSPRVWSRISCRPKAIYALALPQLTARYSDHRIIDENHIEELYKAPIDFFGDGGFIGKQLNVIIETTGVLQKLSYAVDRWDHILSHLLEKKLEQYVLEHNGNCQWIR